MLHHVRIWSGIVGKLQSKSSLIGFFSHLLQTIKLFECVSGAFQEREHN